MANILLPYAEASQASTSHKANICLPLCTLFFVCWPGPVGLLSHQAVKHAPKRQVLPRQTMRSLRACLPRTDCRLRLGEARPSRRTGEPCDVRHCSIRRCIAFARQATRLDALTHRMQGRTTLCSFASSVCPEHSAKKSMYRGSSRCSYSPTLRARHDISVFNCFFLLSRCTHTHCLAAHTHTLHARAHLCLAAHTHTLHARAHPA